MVISFEFHQKNKINFVKNWFYAKIPIFLKFFFRLSRKHQTLLAIFDFFIPNTPTSFTFLLENILKSKIGAFLLPQMLMTEKQNTHRC